MSSESKNAIYEPLLFVMQDFSKKAVPFLFLKKLFLSFKTFKTF